MKVLILQTCDGVWYKPMLDTTEPFHRMYAARHGYDYIRFDGLKRGMKPWHATFNRMYMLRDVLKEGKYDWALYVDADCVICDFAKTVDEFIVSTAAFVACRGASDDPNVFWDFNAGVMFINMRHAQMPAILDAWINLYEKVPLKTLEDERDDAFDRHANQFADDQSFLQAIVRHLGPTSIKREYGERAEVFNYGGPYIKQILRAESKGVDDRLGKIQALTEEMRVKYMTKGPTKIL